MYNATHFWPAFSPYRPFRRRHRPEVTVGVAAEESVGGAVDRTRRDPERHEFVVGPAYCGSVSPPPCDEPEWRHQVNRLSRRGCESRR